ncbi:SusC/RagA family TonB-linked outer membrane protein [Sphingobacterium sp. UBA7625]|uniref:SusC/RagA family TonB-linked outer membrane protein n=1 Tax=Sphingobacterium sp. UBA7625 TaxID=1947522 RepID=UPI00257B841A|nr:SusC/RagA family TonB-linked outer membrane protein [Sphingobacterium sp. UBA7625]
MSFRNAKEKWINWYGLVIFTGVLFPSQGYAQAQPGLKGRVEDQQGKPLSGVSVYSKSTAKGAVTTNDGEFTIPSAAADTLTFSFIGYDTQKVGVGGRSNLVIKLIPNNEQLSEVVVIGYGQQRKGDLTSSVATVTSENFVKAPVQDAGQLLQGKVAGLSVGTTSGNPTGGSQILLRGNTTLFGANSDPLVIIDGIPGTLNTVAPEDIESIDVLKDGSAAAIYGVRGTNGVIIITTKRAKGQETNVIDYAGSVSTQSILRQPQLLTATDYRRQIKEGTRDASWDLGSDTDWLKEISQTPLTHIHNLTFRGGSSKTNYLASANYRYLEGILKRSDNETFSGRIDVNHSMLDNKLKFNLSLLNQTNSFTQTQDGGTFNGYTYRQALIFNPTSPVYNDKGDWFEQPSNFNYENPLARLYESDGQTRSVNSRMAGTITYNPIADLKLSSLFSYSRNNITAGYSETKNHISNLRDSRNGYAALGNRLIIDRLMELTAEYTKTIGKHRGSILGGYGYQENENSSSFIQNWDFPTDVFGYNNIGLGNAIKDGKGAIGSDKFETNLISFFGRLTYSYDDRYLLLASVRHEGASQLVGAKSPWGTFSAISGGWRISNESFMEDQTVFDDLKLRAGYGVTGNPPSNLFLGQAQLGYGGYIYSNGHWVQSLGPTSNPNPNIRWEEKRESNFGLDFSLLKGLVSGNIDYYIRDIKGLLYDYQVPSPPNLVTTTRANVGTMRNNGIEVLLNIAPVRKPNFEWNTSLLFSTNTNKLKSLSNELYQTTNDYFTTGGTGEPIQTFTNIVYIGQQIGDFYGFKVVDIDDSGKWIYEGADAARVAYNDFGHTFEDKKVLGNGLPKYYAGWNNNFRYKNIDLSVTMRGAFDYQILNFQRMYLENPSLQNYNRLASSEDLVFGKAKLTAPLEFNSYYIEDGDHWKIDNITLGYTFRNMKSKWLNNARIYASSLNTFVITGYKGIDPEVNRLGLAPGNDDRDKYPTTRTFTFGVNVSF